MTRHRHPHLSRTALGLALVIFLAGAAATTARAVGPPAAVDQYTEQPPLGPGGSDAYGNAFPVGGGPVTSGPSTRTSPAGSIEPRAAEVGAETPANQSRARLIEAPSGDDDGGTLPTTSYPLSTLVAIVVGLLLLGLAIRVAWAGYGRLRRAGV